jgi:hypothetical protein
VSLCETTVEGRRKELREKPVPGPIGSDDKAARPVALLEEEQGRAGAPGSYEEPAVLSKADLTLLGRMASGGNSM